MTTFIENRKALLGACLVFTVGALVWLLVSRPVFPVSSPYGVSLPYRFPVLAFVVPCWLLYFNRKRQALLWLLLMVPILWVSNIHMLRPDFYFLWLCLLILALSKDKRQVFAGFLLVLAGMYLWTSIHKMNMDFVQAMSKSFEKRLLPESLSPVSNILATAIPVLEFILALLCISPYRKFRLVLGVTLHTGILFFLIKGQWNYTMIGWNVSLAGLHIVLPEFSLDTLKKNRSWWLVSPILSLVFPAFYFLGTVTVAGKPLGMPGFASWTMYSARIQHYRLEIDEQTALYPPSYIREYVYRKDGVYSVSITEWANAETGGPPCMEPIFTDRVLRDCRDHISKNR